MKYGGVEVGIVRSHAELNEEFIYKVVCLSGSNEINDIKVYTLREFLLNVKRSDKVIVSLWKAYLLGWVLNLLGYNIVPFVHHSGNVHFIANIVTKITTQIFTIGLADSSASANYYNSGYFIAPYIFDFSIDRSAERSIDVIWVGRDAAEKRFGLSMKIMDALAVKGYNVLSIVASDKKYQFKHLVKYNLAPETVLGEMAKSRVYMQLSTFEGFSMSTVEAIACGCRPFVTPVGEIKSYLSEEYHVSDLELISVISEIEKILSGTDLGLQQRIERLSSYGSYTETLKYVLNEA